MDKIKEKDLASLIQNGFLNFIGEDEEVLNCLSEDLTLQEIDSSISTTENFIVKLYDSMRKLTELEKRNFELYEQLEKENEKIKQKEEEEDSAESSFIICVIALLLGIGLCIFAIIDYPKVLVELLIFGICTIIADAIFFFLHHNRNSEIEFSTELLNKNIKSMEQEQEKTLNSMIAMYSEIYVSPKFLKIYLTADRIIEKHIKRLGLLLTNLKKLKVIQEDSSFNPAAKMLAISQLFMLINQSISNAKMLTEQKVLKKEQMDQANEILRELQKQNDLMELNTYNKLSELSGHNPALIAAQTYAQLDRINKNDD